MLDVKAVFWLYILGQGGESTALGALYLAVWSRKQDEKGGPLLDISESCGTKQVSHFPTV